MKKLLFIILILWSVQANSQASFRIKDSTLRFMTGTLTSKVPQFLRPMYGQELSRNNSSSLKMMVIDTARAALGLKAWYWQDIPSAGSGNRQVDSIYRTLGKDSIQFIINGSYYAIKDSTGGGSSGITVGSTTITSGTNKRFAHNSAGVYGESGNMTQETNQILITGTSTSVVPFRITPASGATVSGFRVDNYLGDSVFTIDPTGNAYIGKQTTVNYTRTFTFAYGLDAHSSAGFRIKDLANGNGVVLNAAYGGYLDVRDISGIGGGISASNWNNPSTGNKITTGPYGFTFNDPIVMGSARLSKKQGADVTSANNLSLGTDGNAFEITGTTTINLISNTNWQNGSVIRLVFSSSLTVTNNAGTSGSNINILLAGGANFSATANDILTLMLCEIGSVQNWVEVSRSVN